MSLPVFCNASLNLSAIKPDQNIADLNFILYCGITPIFLVFGIFGNILNLITLRNPTLRSIPFMYITGVAVFDLIGLIFVIGACLRIGGVLPHIYPLAFYQAHIESPAMNTCLAASLYTAVVLTIERYLMVCRPHHHVSANPKRMAKINIFIVFMLAVLLHIPLASQWIVDSTNTNGSRAINNKFTQCHEPWASMFAWYERVREGVRLGGVLVMTVFNLIITRKLQLAKKKRRTMTLKSMRNPERSQNAVLSSFTEKKLTALMAAITILYIVGNTPQAINMVIHEDMHESKFTHQIFRGMANLFEVLNHCLNFYVFCVASSDYSQAFLQNCLCLKRIFPCCINCIDKRTRRKSLNTNLTEVSMNTLNNNKIKTPEGSPFPLVQRTEQRTRSLPEEDELLENDKNSNSISSDEDELIYL